MGLYIRDGFEHGDMGRYSVLGSPSIVTSPVRTGLRALEIDPTGGSNNVSYTIPSGNQIVTQTIYTRWPSLPTSTDRVIARVFGTNQCFVQFHPSTNQFGVRIGGVNTVGGPTIVAGQWYLLDFVADYRANPNVIRLRVDLGTEITDDNPVAASDITSVRIGTDNPDTHTVHHDDWGISLTAGDYPVGEHAYTDATNTLRVGAGRRAGN